MSTKPARPSESELKRTKVQLPGRFYKHAKPVEYDGRYVLELDGRKARTPARNVLGVGDKAVAAALAAEWNAQVDRIDPAQMPVTRLVNVALDRVSTTMDEVRSEIVRYFGSDLLCYRAGEPDELVTRQRQVWDPLVAWAGEQLDSRFNLTEGIVAVDQPPELATALDATFTDLGPLALAGLHTATMATGSAILALALLRGRLDVDSAWDAANLDEDWQMEKWGRDDMVLAARVGRKQDLHAAVLVLAGA